MERAGVMSAYLMEVLKIIKLKIFQKEDFEKKRARKFIESPWKIVKKLM